MNAGMYGMADGRGMAGRKLAGILQGQAVSVVSGVGGVSTFGVVCSRNYTTQTLTGGVRTRIGSVTGRGAVRGWIVETAAAADTIRAELWIDGKSVLDITGGTAAAGQHINVVGAFSGSSVVLAIFDYIPFDSSCELFVTATTGGGSAYRYPFRIDIHE